MPSTLIRPYQIHTSGSTINDALTPSDHDANAADLEDTINYICSQFADITGKVAWETAPDISLATVNAKTFMDDFTALRRLGVLQTITVPAAVAATGSITTVATASLVDGETFVLDDGVNAQVTFHFDVSGTYTPGGGYDATNIRVDVSGDTTADDVRDTIITAVDGVGAGLAIDASNGGAATVTLTNDASGGVGNRELTETVTNVGFSITNMTGGAGDYKVLVFSSSETPTRNIAYGGAAIGAVSAQLAANHFDSHRLTEVTGKNSLKPKNLVIVFDSTTGDPLKSDDRQIYALLQVENGATDGAAFDDSTNQGQLSFVRPNATYDDLEPCPAADIAGLTINYSYADRAYLADWSEDDFLPDSYLVDIGDISITMDEAYNGGSTVAVDNTNVDFRLTDTKRFYVSDSSGSTHILEVQADAAGDNLIMNGDLDMNGNIAGGTYQAAFNGVTIGSASGRVSTASGDLDLRGADDISFVTVRETTPLPLDDATAGAISGLFSQSFASVSAAIKYAGEHGGVDMTIGVSVLASNYAQDANIPGGAGGLDISSPHSIDMNTPSGVDTILFLNGRLLLGGNGTTKNDVYAGDTPASGDIKAANAKGVKSGDVIIAIRLAQ